MVCEGPLCNITLSLMAVANSKLKISRTEDELCEGRFQIPSVCLI